MDVDGDANASSPNSITLTGLSTGDLVYGLVAGFGAGVGTWTNEGQTLIEEETTACTSIEWAHVEKTADAASENVESEYTGTYAIVTAIAANDPGLDGIPVPLIHFESKQRTYLRM